MIFLFALIWCVIIPGMIGYATAVLGRKYDLPLWVVMLSAGASGGLVGGFFTIVWGYYELLSD